MNTLRALWCRIVGVFRPASSDTDFDAEMESHLELHIDEGVRVGLSPQEARRQAILALGGLERTREARRDRRGLPFVETMAMDVSFALRLLRRDAGWALVAVVLMSLAIGANTAVYSAAHASLFATLPVVDPDKLVALKWYGDNPAAERSSSYGHWAGAPDTQRWAGSFSFAAYEELARRTQTLTDLFAFGPTDLWVTVDGPPERPLMQFVSGNYYGALGVRPRLGRLITPADEAAAAPVAVISEEFWQRRFGGRASAVGASLAVEGQTFTIVGVAPAGLPDLYRPGGRIYDLSLPLTTEPLLFDADSKVRSPADWWLVAMGRRRTDATIEQVYADLDPVFRQVAGERDQPRAEVGPLHLVVRSGARGAYDVRPELSTGLALAGGFFAAILIIVTANIANLVLFRGAVREREFALRSAIGCSRRRLIRQLLTENVVLAALGCGLGLAVAAVAVRLLPTLDPSLQALTLSLPAVGLAVAASGAVALALGVLPALRLTKDSRADGASRATYQPGRSWLGRTLVVLQVALSLVLLVCTSLFVRTFDNLRGTPSGFQPEGLVFFRLNVGPLEYSPERQAGLRATLLDEIQVMPGVRSAALTNQTLLTGGSNSGRVTLEDGTLTDPIGTLTGSPGFFETMGIPIRRGRGFLLTDYDGGPPVSVVSQSFADRFFAGRDPIGRTFQAGFHAEGPIRIVGVAADVKHATLRAAPVPMFYMAARKEGRPLSMLYVRSEGAPELVISAIQTLVSRIDPALPQQSLTRQTDAIESLYGRERQFAIGSSLSGGLALLTATIGVFGLMSCAVARRTREIGIRMALGARAEQVLRSVVREGLVLVAVGAVIGVAVAVAATRLIGSFLYELSPTDPLAIASAVVILLFVATLASLLPARRASRVDPVIALRQE